MKRDRWGVARLPRWPSQLQPHATGSRSREPPARSDNTNCVAVECAHSAVPNVSVNKGKVCAFVRAKELASFSLRSVESQLKPIKSRFAQLLSVNASHHMSCL